MKYNILRYNCISITYYITKESVVLLLTKHILVYTLLTCIADLKDQLRKIETYAISHFTEL